MNRQTLGYIAALLVSLFGNSLSMLALPWFLLETTGDVKYTSIVLGLRLIPVTLSLFYGTKFIDHFSKKTICIATDLLSAIFVIAIPALYSVSMLNVGILLVLICALAAIEQIAHAALGSLVPDILKTTSISPERFNGIIGSLNNFGDLAAPPVAGLLIAFAGSTIALVLDSVTFLVSAIILSIFIKTLPKPTPRNTEESTINGIKLGFLFIFNNHKTRYILIPSIIINFLIFPLLSLIVPYIAKTKFDSSIDLGLMISAFGRGTLLSSVIFASIGERFSKYLLIVSCNLILVFCFFFAIFAASVYTIMALLFLVGLSVGMQGPLDDTILQTTAPDEIRGRVLLTYSFLRFAMIPLAMVIFGFLLENTSIQTTFAVMAASLVPVMIWLLVNRQNLEATSSLMQ